jgi:hypothetical protein
MFHIGKSDVCSRDVNRASGGGAAGAEGTGAELFNKALLREQEQLAAKLEAPLKHVVAPPPLHDFTHDDADALQSIFPKSGIPGRRMLRLRPDMAPQHMLACENEPEGPRTSPDDVEKVVEERDGMLVYQCNFQDLPRDTPAIIMQRLDRQCADASNPQENLTALRPYYTPESEDDTVLVFESRFESGNLFGAHQVITQQSDSVGQHSTVCRLTQCKHTHSLTHSRTHTHTTHTGSAIRI